MGIPYAGFRVQKNHEIMERQMAEDMGMDFHGKKPGSDSRKLQKANIHL
jgi:hypothetical protein